MRALLLLGATVLATTVSHAAIAQKKASSPFEKQMEQLMTSRLGTTSIDAYPQFADGKLFACIIEYNSLVRDNVDRVGTFMKVFGSFGLMAAQGGVGLTLKIVVHDFDLSTGNTTPNAPKNGYFVFGNETSRSSLAGAYPSDVPGALFAVFRTDAIMQKFVDSLVADKLTFAFNRRSGSADITVGLDLTVKSTDDTGRKSYSPEMVLDFFKCSKDLIAAARKPD
jgi:hypothetical protein